MAADFSYEGSELDLFGAAKNWKAYWASIIAPFVGRNVLDVGAGLGATAATLSHLPIERWTALEPDAGLAERIAAGISAGRLPQHVEVRCGSLSDLPPDGRYETVLYIDVLEHIEDDAGELELAARVLTPTGRIVILAPAHQWLYSPFDRAIGHFRRYDRDSLLAVKPEGFQFELLRYLDSAGMLASLANRLLLRTPTPTPAQIAFWDRCLVPASRVIDPLCSGRLGKTIVGVLARPQSSSTHAAAQTIA